MAMRKQHGIQQGLDGTPYYGSEKDFTTAIIELAKILGYRVCHARPAQTIHGWRTPWQGHAGCPDLIIAGRGRLIFAELKMPKGKLDPEQEEWREALESSPAEYYLWYPYQWDEIVAVLNRF